jgi:hypothetical protein
MRVLAAPSAARLTNPRFPARGDSSWEGRFAFVGSASVRLRCDERIFVVSAEEIEKCAYAFVVAAPAACTSEQLDLLLAESEAIDAMRSQIRVEL